MSAAELVAILFTDVVGSTARAAEVGDAAADELRRMHFAHLREAIAATAGTEVKTIGDAIMVSYGGAADAIASAVAMQRAVERHNRHLDGHEIQMRVGVSVGDATFEDGDWFGTPVIEAARLCAAAEGRQILVNDVVRTFAGSRNEFEVHSLGARELKGLPDPVAVCEVRWLAPGDDIRIPFPSFVDSSPAFSFAGRARELAALDAAWKEVSDGARRVVLVSGEPGIGKTRLVSEVARSAYEEGAVVLWGRCDEALGSSYQPVTEALRQYVAAVPPERLRAELGPLGGELRRILPDLSARVPGLVDPLQSDAETERYRLFEAVGDLIGEVSQNDPVVLVLDDLQWSDKPSLLLLRHLLRGTTAMRLLVVGTYRDTDRDRTHPLADFLVDLRREHEAERLDLHGLDETAVVELLEAAAGHDLDESALALARAVHEETQGNPFFVGEVLRHLRESGAILRRDGRWTSDLTLDAIGIPEGIREVVSRRLSRLSDVANRALALGAVVGAQFDVATIEGAGGPTGDALLDALDEATRATIIREVPGVVGQYAFVHALVRSTLYEEIPTNRRARMHWQIGEALGARYEHDLDEHLDELGYHYCEGALAGNPLVAAQFARRAGERAVRELAFEAAVHHFRRALGAFELADEPELETRCDLQIALGAALRDSGDEIRRDVVFAAAKSARALGDADRLARATLIFATGASAASVGTTDQEILALFEEALEAIGPEPAGVRALLLIGLAQYLSQAEGAAERRQVAAREALTVARTTGDPNILSAVLARSETLFDHTRPHLDEAEALNDDALALAREHGRDPVVVAMLHRSKAGLAGCRGDRDAFEAHVAELVRVADGLRRPIQTAYALEGAAAFHAFVGDLAPHRRGGIDCAGQPRG